MEETVFLNGKFLPLKEAKISVLEPGFLYGWGLFETMRSYDTKIIYFNAHLQRIRRSCELIKIEFPYPIDKFKGIIRKAVKLSGQDDAYVRMTLYKTDTGAGVLIRAKKYEPPPLKKYRKGFRACISTFRQNEDSFFAKIKTVSYILYRIAYLEAKNKGFDEAIILNNRGFIAEGSRSNIFLAKDREIFTPALECGCLDGITRKVVLDLAKKYDIKICEGNYSLLDLYDADETFLTNSLMGIMPLVRIDKKPIARGVVGKLTRIFMKEYNLLLKNGT